MVIVAIPLPLRIVKVTALRPRVIVTVFVVVFMGGIMTLVSRESRKKIKKPQSASASRRSLAHSVMPRRQWPLPMEVIACSANLFSGIPLGSQELNDY